jgi:hypothetical protein
MAWVWCSAATAWIAGIGPVSDGFVYPEEGATEPNLSSFASYLTADGEVDLFSGPADLDPCDYDWGTTPHVFWNPGTGLWGGTEAGTIPTGAWMFVVAAGPSYTETDPEPSWDPALALIGADPLPYQVVVVAQDGIPYGTLSNARPTRVSWELNGPGTAEISVATTDPDVVLLQPGREVQIYRDGITDPIWWGPIIRPQAGLNETTWQCAGLLWYFEHRYMGRADRINALTNGDFEAGETGWTFSGVTHSVNTDLDFVVEGTKSEKLTGATADHATYATQTFTHGPGGYPTGDYITGSVWVWISAADYLGPAIEDFGLVLRRKNAAGEVVDAQWEPARINDDTPRDQWVPLEVGIANVIDGDTVDFLLFPPHGVAYFDLATLTFMESLSLGYPTTPVDVSVIVAAIVDYAQDRAPFDFGHGKSDLNIGTAGSATGTTRQVAYQFAEHRNILDAILEYVRQGIIDIDIAFTATTRTFTTYAPKKGSLYGTTLQLDVNLADFTWSQDLEQAASSVVLLGPGDGPDRPEGGATDTSFVGGAFTSEIVEQAPDNTTVGQLDQRAEERLKVAARPEILEITTLPGAGVIGDLAVGDTVPVLIAWGWVDIDATYRVARIEADLLKDQATITLNPIP